MQIGLSQIVPKRAKITLENNNIISIKKFKRTQYYFGS